MISNAKYRINSLAKDLNMKSAELVNLLKAHGIDGKTHMAVLEPEEFDIIMEALTAQNQITNLAEYLAGKADVVKRERKPEPVKSAEEEKPVSKVAPKKDEKQPGGGQPASNPRPAAQTDKRETPEERKNKFDRFKNRPRPEFDKKQDTRADRGTRTADHRPPKASAQEQLRQRFGTASAPSASTQQGNNQQAPRRDAGPAPIKTTRVVDTRTVSVDLSKYDERLEHFVEEKKEYTAEKQKLKKKNNQYDRSRSEREKERLAMEKLKKEQLEKARKKQLEITVPDEITVGELAQRLKVTASEVIKRLMGLGIMANVNQVIDYDTAFLIGDELGAKVTKEIVVTIEERLFDDTEDAPEALVERAPVVCVMGHVDHGKTSLLDAIRNTNVTSGEAGGITQHIGAYRVNINNRDITFLDTPGHEAFTAMRARGAKSTDIAILVVAADDGIMPQTVEAINHAKAAGISIIVAINKMDKPHANPDNVKSELTKYELVPEDWGGDTICVPVSAITHQGIEELLEMVILVSDMKELKANPNRHAKGVIIESRLDKGRGPVATVLVQNGTLESGDIVIAGTSVGRVRAMTDDRGRSVKTAGPSVPVEITGLAEVPSAGDIIQAVDDEKMARELADKRRNELKESEFKANARANLDDLFAQISLGTKELNIIVKADVAGSVEAVRASLEKLSNDEVRVRIIHTGVGGVNEGDVMLAAASNAIIIGFNVRPDKLAMDSAERQQVDIRTYRIIYECIEEVSAAMKGMLAPTFKEVVLGHAEVRQAIHVPNVGTIAGSYIQDGKITRSSQIRVVRDGSIIFEDKISSLRRFKDDVRDVASGYECGIGLERFNDIREGDILEAFVMEEVAR